MIKLFTGTETAAKTSKMYVFEQCRLLSVSKSYVCFFHLNMRQNAIQLVEMRFSDRWQPTALIQTSSWTPNSKSRKKTS